MISKRLKIFLFISSILCAGAWISIVFFSKRFPTVYDETIQNTSFQNIVLEKDSALSDHLVLKNIDADSNSTLSSVYYSHNSFSPTGLDSINEEPEKTPVEIDQLPIGRSLTANHFPDMHAFNSRVKITTFFKTFSNGDFITGAEISKLYKRDPTISKLAKATICNFVEKNISKITRIDNSLIISTVQDEGIHTKIKIPFVEDLRINIANGSSIDIGETFASKETKFYKSILMPVKLNSIDIMHNGEAFPKKGYISGDFYFIEYSRTKMAYKIR